MVWSDEFTGSNLDTSKWSFERNCTGGGNNELQCYTDRAENTFLADGYLHIVAKKETFSGQAKSDDDPAYNPGDMSATRNYTSARLRSKNKGDWKYGRMDIRAKLPQGQGIWPAIWMLPTEQKYGGWPLSGEIDIMEAVNSNTAAAGNKVYGTLHYGDAWPANKNTGTSFTSPTNVWDEFHTYSVEWEEGEIRFYVDNTHYATQTKNGWYSAGAPAGNAPFDEKFHMILNVAVGGQWPGNPDATTVLPQEMSVDYVHVYECSADPVTGKGCATINPAIVPLAGNQKPTPLETVTSSFDVFVDAVDARWDNGVLAYNSGDYQIQTTVIDSDVPARGKVINVKYGNTSGLAYIQSKGPKDVSVFTGASYLEFDVKVLNYGAATGLTIKADCSNPCGSGDIPIGKKGDGAWETVQVPVSTLVAGGLNLTKLNTPFVIFPTWGAQTGVELQLDNIRWVRDSSTAVVTFAPLPLFTMYADAVASSLAVQSYNPDGVITSSSIADTDAAHGQVFNVVKTGANGNVFFNINGGAKDLRHWSSNGKLVFDVKVNSRAVGSTLLVKMDGGWPNVSDVEVTLGADGEWTTYSIDIADLIDNANSNPCCGGIADLASITNMFVIEPSAAMNVSFDNVRFEEGSVDPVVTVFAPLSLFTMYDNAVVNSLAVQSYNPDGFISSSSIADTDAAHGQVFSVVKTGATGNVFFNINGGAKDLSHWTSSGKLVFDIKVNSRAAGATLLVKMDSGWPNVSDAQVTLGADGVWTTYSIDIADLINNPNSNPCCGGIVNIASVANIFVLEPSAAMNLSVDNIRLETMAP